MTDIKIVSHNDIESGFDIYYCGWTDGEISDLKKNYQTNYLGDLDDLRLEIISDYSDPYYAIFRSGEGFKQQKQFLSIEERFIIMVHANGHFYRFDTVDKTCLDNGCYSSIMFDNTQNKKQASPYISTYVSDELGIMAVVDNEGVAVMTFDRVLWKVMFDFAYADELKILSISKSSLQIKYTPCGDTRFISLDTMSGNRLKNH